MLVDSAGGLESPSEKTSFLVGGSDYALTVVEADSCSLAEKSSHLAHLVIVGKLVGTWMIVVAQNTVEMVQDMLVGDNLQIAGGPLASCMVLCAYMVPYGLLLSSEDQV